MPHTDERNEFYKTVLSIKDYDECRDFFEDICTIKELDAISQRLMVAKLLKSGKTFNEIAEISGVSSATISRVNKCLVYGKGYKSVLADKT